MSTEPIKALSIKQPWADHILFDGKDVENRSWRLPPAMIGQRIQIHAGKRPDGEYRGDPARLGALLGEVTIVGCVTTHPSPWFNGPFGFVLRDPVAYAVPVPYKGCLGFFTPDLGQT